MIFSRFGLRAFSSRGVHAPITRDGDIVDLRASPDVRIKNMRFGLTSIRDLIRLITELKDAQPHAQLWQHIFRQLRQPSGLLCLIASVLLFVVYGLTLDAGAIVEAILLLVLLWVNVLVVSRMGVAEVLGSLKSCLFSTIRFMPDVVNWKH